LTLAAGALAATGIAFGLRSSSAPTEYDYETSIRKLRAIGAALQIYRQEYGYLEPALRRTSRDAGLPDSCVMLGQQGFAWSLREGAQAFSVAKPSWPSGRTGSPFHFTKLYISPPFETEHRTTSEWFARRGERLPIYADLNMNSIESRADKHNTMQRAIILRLNGEVEIVEFDWMGNLDILTK
jgi:hypothetical protein